MICHNCQKNISASRVRILEGMVSSDCQPVSELANLAYCEECGLVQKIADENWQKICSEVYKNYKIYAQADGEEQKVKCVTTGDFKPRSELLTDFVKGKASIAGSGSILDIGCGNGAFLTKFHEVAPGWSINGTELNPTFKDDILNISKTSRFFDGEQMENVEEKFSLVSLIHCLEHIPSPSSYLQSIARLFENGGWLMIQVPDAEKNPFDLLIADHASHFSAQSLNKIVEDSGVFDVIECGNLVLGKELTLIARFKQPEASNIDTKGKNYMFSHIDWIEKLKKQALSLAEKNEKVTIFGSSIAATWFARVLDGKIASFLDEDPNRLGKSHLGIEVRSPDQVASDDLVFIPLEPTLAEMIGDKLKNKGWNVFVPPKL